MSTFEKIYDRNSEQTLRDFFTFLRFESVSTEEEYTPRLLACAEWLKKYIESLGFSTELWETSGHPVIYAKNLDAGPDKPTLLIYNHYDVQPVDPLELWDSSPFEPTIRDGEIYARGAQDNKGQCFYVLQGIKLLLERDGRLPINIKLCIEGEEESGSEGLSQILKHKKKELAADYLAVVDLGIPSMETPALSLGIRGIVTFDLEVEGSNGDLHSGQHGGIVYNPLHALVEILAALRDTEGRITIPGFYDHVQPLNAEEKKEVRFDFNPEEYRNMFGTEATGGEKGFTPYERAGIRPTLEVNGVQGGYCGKGFKTVIPAKASAKLSCRLVPDQDPERISALVCNYIKNLTPKGVRVTIKTRPGSGEAVRAESSSPLIRAFAKAYEAVLGHPVNYLFQGGSIPIAQELAEAAGASIALVGLGLPDDAIHAPNEHFGVDRLKKGALTLAETIAFLT